jgi:RecB family exonuclease
MASLHLRPALDPARLLELALDGLLPIAPPSPAHPWPTLPAWIVLRQGGLRDDLHRLAAARGAAGWFDPPVILFAELAARWSGDDRPALGAEERTALLSAILARHADGVFGAGVDPWVTTVDRLIGELVSEGITPASFAAALTATADRDHFERRRDDTLAAIYTEWTDTLARLGRVDGRDALVRLAASIEADPDGFALRLGRRRDVRIAGLADLRGGWRPLLAALAATPVLESVTILASHALELPPSLGATVHDDPAPPPLAAALFTGRDAPATTVSLLEAPDAAREVELVAVRVRALLDDGVPPLRIAVVARQARPLVDQVADALGALGVPVTARRRTALSHTGPARALQALLVAATETWSRHTVVELAEHPLLSLAFDADVLDYVGRSTAVASLDGWRIALTDLLDRCVRRDAREAEDDRRNPLPDTTRVRATRDAWLAFLPLAAPLDAQRPQAAWFAWAEEVLTGAAWRMHEALAAAPAGDERIRRADVRARDRIIALARSWREALARFDGGDRPLDAARFAQRLALVLEEDLIDPPETGDGVIVAESLAAGWRAVDHLFVVGLASGEFPRRPPPSPLLGARDRRALIAGGLPLDPPDEWRTRERELFRVLCAAPRTSLTLSWPAMDADGREVARSAYIDEVAGLVHRHLVATGTVTSDMGEDDALRAAGVLQQVAPKQVLTPGYPVLPREGADEALAHAARVAAIEAARTTAPSPYNGRVEDGALRDRLAARFGESYIWSATQLESLASCGWRWFAARLLRLETPVEPDDGLEPTTRGTILHDALDRFFEAARRHVGSPAYLRDDDRDWAASAAEVALNEAWTAAEQAGSWLGAAVLRDVLRAELVHLVQGYVAFEIAHNEECATPNTGSSKHVQTGAERGEEPFDGVVLEGGGVRFLLRGVIDRVDRGCDERIDAAEQYIAAIDYKTSRSATPAGGKRAGWDDGAVLQVPLYAAVLRARFPDDVLARLEYRTLRSPAVVHQLNFAPVRGAGRGRKAVVPDEAAELKLRRALDAAGACVSKARAGVLAASPLRSTGCSPYCPARDVCRIPGGPREGAR